MLNLGDIKSIDGGSVPPVEVITGGSPCQNLSMAGNRQGLNGRESSLFFEQVRVARQMHVATNGQYPKFMVWENVPGAFTSNHGRDFLTVLEGFIYAATGKNYRLPMPSKWGGSGFITDEVGSFSVAWRLHDAQFWGVPQRRKRIAAVIDFSGKRAGEILFEPTSERRDSQTCRTARETATEDNAGCTARLMRNLSYHEYVADYTASTLTATNALGATSLVCYDCRGNGSGTVVPTIAGDHNSRVGDYAGVVTNSARIRRLTPLECERLQGYPDGWTDIPGASDTRRYKALGNSIAIPFWQHLMLRVSKHCKDKTLASLFDGIGGFPLCWERAGGVTLWSSEIDPFPASVSDAHFLSI